MDSTLARQRPPAPDAWGRGAALAVLVHVGLLVAIAFGVSWRSSEPAGVEAELWAAVPQVAAPRIEQPQPQPQPQPAPPPPAPQKSEPAPQPREAEIAIEKEKARLEKERLDKERAEKARLEKLQREKEREDAERREKAEELKRKQAAEREAQRKREEEEKRLAQLREENLKKMLAQAGGTGAPNATGSAAQSAGPSAGYAGRLKARIKPNIVFADDLPGNPSAEVEVRAAPDGTITGRRLVKSSGVKEWDDAVLRAIDRTEVLPRDTDGRVPSPIVITFRPKD